MSATTASNSGHCPQRTVIPTSGDSSSTSPPCITASVVTPRIFPSTKLSREAGATSTERRNPSRRSSITEMFEKMDVKRRIMSTVPGKKYSRYPVSRPPDDGRKEFPKPDPIRSQKTTGVPKAPTTRLRWRRKRTISLCQRLARGRKNPGVDGEEFIRRIATEKLLGVLAAAQPSRE